MIQGNVLVGQSGGPTAAINASLSGVLRGYHKAEKNEDSRIYGMKNGIEGFLREDLIDLTELAADNDALKTLEMTPGSALGSCRLRLPDPEKEPEKYDRMFEVFEKYDIRAFFYIGGNDSMDTVAKLSAYGKKIGKEVSVIGVPKTIDNDLVHTDHTPGFGSAAKYVAATVKEIRRDLAVYTVRSVTIVEIMGRDSGWLTAAAALPLRPGSAPDLIYLPEKTFDPEEFLSDIAAAHAVHPDVMVCVSEGIRTSDGHYVGEGLSRSTDAFGHVQLSGAGKVLEQLVRERVGCKVRSIELNLPQRCASHLASATDIAESVGVGMASVREAEAGNTAVMLTIRRLSKPGEAYVSDFVPLPVSEIANKVKVVPPEYINERGNFVTDACLDYLEPLISGERFPEYENGMPKHLVLF